MWVGGSENESIRVGTAHNSQYGQHHHHHCFLSPSIPFCRPYTDTNWARKRHVGIKKVFVFARTPFVSSCSRKHCKRERRSKRGVCEARGHLPVVVVVATILLHKVFQVRVKGGTLICPLLPRFKIDDD